MDTTRFRFITRAEAIELTCLLYNKQTSVMFS